VSAGSCTKSGTLSRLLNVPSYPRHSPCEFPIQAFIVSFLILGLPASLCVDAVHRTLSFRYVYLSTIRRMFRVAFLVEMVFVGVSLSVLLVTTHLILQKSDASCVITTSSLWRVLEISVFSSWTVVVVGAVIMIVATSAALFAPVSKTDVLDYKKTPVLGHKFKTYYGTL